MLNPSTATPSLKIGFILDDSLDTADGVQQYILTLGAWLREQGHEVHYLVGETHRDDVPNVHSLARNIAVRFNRNRMSIPLPASKAAIRSLLTREDFDILHVQLPYSPFLAGRIIQATPKRTALVGTFHIAPHSKLVHVANHVLHGLTRRTLARFDQIMSVSPVARKFAYKTFAIKSDVVPNTVNLTPYLRAIGLPQYKQSLTIVFLGRLVDRKGCQHLLRAVAKLNARRGVRVPYKVVICGKGPLESSLKNYVHEQSIDHLVEFVGFVSEAEKPRILASADIAIFPSTGGESFGIVLVEAMAAARGVVLAGNNPGYASVMGAHPEVLFDPENERALSDKLETFMNDPGARQIAHKWQRADVLQYDVSTVGARVVQQYTQALHKRSR